MVPFQLVSKSVGSIWTFGLTAVEPTLFRVVGMDTYRPLHFDGTNFSYYKARMACYLETVDLEIWRVTRDEIKPIKNPDKPTKSDEKEMYFNARAKNCLFESFSMDVFNQVFTLNTHMKFGSNSKSSMTAQVMSVSKNIV